MTGRRSVGRIVVWVTLALAVAAGLVLVGRWSVPLNERPGFAPPAAMPILVSPRVGTVTDLIPLSAQVQFRSAVTVPLLTAQPDAFRHAVTAAPLQVGDEVEVGDLLGEINGIPVFAMRGAVPSFRAMYSGDRGVDVEQLTASLVRLGYLRTATKEVTPTVLTATERFLNDRGYRDLGGALAKHGIDGRLFAFVPALPATVAASQAAVGAIVDEGAAPTVTLIAGDPELVVAPARAGVELPAGVAISATCGSRTLAGELTDDRATWRASDEQGEGEAVPETGWVVDTHDADAETVGASCAATATVSQGDADTVWVPAAALFSAADGTPQLRIPNDDGAGFAAVAVETGAPVGGWVPLVDPPSTLTASTQLLAGDT